MQNTTHLLIVDDDPEICELVAQFLEPYGFRVSTAANGQAMRQILAKETVDLVILDLMLPQEDGFSLCRQLRASSSNIPVVFLTAVGGETDRIVGLEMGADDYLTKPFSSRELLARVRAVLRRTGTVPAQSTLQVQPQHRGQILTFAGWTLDTGRRQLMSPDGVLVELTGGEYELLFAFLKSPHVVLNRDQLLDHTRGRASGPYDRTIDVQIGRLRRKIEADPRNPEFIKTVRGGGYIFASNVEAR